MSDEELEIIGVECADGRVFISLVRGDYHFSADRLKNLLFDGKKVEHSFLRDWFIIKQVPKKAQKVVAQPSINYRYELRDPGMEAEKFPAVFKREDVAEVNPGETWTWQWKEEYSHLESLYKLTSDPVDSTLEDVPFIYHKSLSVKELPGPPDFAYDGSGKWATDKLVISRGDIKNQIMDQLIFPGPILHLKPSRLSSQDTYRIIRKHVQNNINPQFAKITSDYDFCFTVQKRIPFQEPEKYTIDVNAFSKRKRAKYEVRYRKSREAPCFEMTNDEAKYKGYTVIDGFIGESHRDLKEKIDRYLKNLMEFINRPLEDCPRCKGMGVILEKKDGHDPLR